MEFFKKLTFFDPSFKFSPFAARHSFADFFPFLDMNSPIQNAGVIMTDRHNYFGFLLIILGTGPDGVTRGAFSYLDDKGMQRSIQYIAGAGIGE